MIDALIEKINVGIVELTQVTMTNMNMVVNSMVARRSVNLLVLISLILMVSHLNISIVMMEVVDHLQIIINLNMHMYQVFLVEGRKIVTRLEFTEMTGEDFHHHHLTVLLVAGDFRQTEDLDMAREGEGVIVIEDETS